MVEKILVPLDGSVLGEKALHYVEDMIDKLRADEKPEIILLHVISMEPYIITSSFSIEPYNPTEIELARQAASHYLQETADLTRAKGFSTSYQIRQGRVVDEIVKAEKELRADLVAISTHGRTGISRWAFGNVAEKVMHTGKLPVLVVRAGKEVNA